MAHACLFFATTSSVVVHVFTLSQPGCVLKGGGEPNVCNVCVGGVWGAQCMSAQPPPHTAVACSQIYML